jgi:hypothetical protein
MSDASDAISAVLPKPPTEKLLGGFTGTASNRITRITRVGIRSTPHAPGPAVLQPPQGAQRTHPTPPQHLSHSSVAKANTEEFGARGDRARAGEGALEELARVWARLEADSHGRVDRMRHEARTVGCCCTAPALSDERGRCSRCFGFLETTP